MKDESLHFDEMRESKPTYMEKITICKEELEDLLSEEEYMAIVSADNEDDVRGILSVAGIDIDDIYNKKENLPR